MVIRVNKNTNYTVMSNYHLQDKKLSLKAKGLLSVLLSLPEDWNYTIQGLISICKENETSVKSALKELKEHKYLKIDKILPNKENGGKYEYIYNIFEQPFEFQEVENQEVENQPLENLPLENHPLYKYTKKQNTNKQNTNEYKKERKKETYNDILSDVQDEELKELYVEFIKMRKLSKAPMTDKALKMLIKRCETLKPNNIAIQKEMLETAIINNWKSVYPIKQNEKKQDIKREPSYNIDKIKKKINNF